MTNDRKWRLGAAIGSGVIALTLIACSVGSPDNNAGSSGIAPVSASPSPVEPDSPSPTPAATASHTAAATPSPSKPPPPAKPGTCPRTPETVGKTESARTILHDLEYAHTIDQFKVQNDPSAHDSRLGGKNPSVYIPLKVLKAMAAQESGWTSNCISSDGLGGYGTMQIQSGTASDANGRFASHYDRMNPRQNILIANAWLEFIAVRFGLEYFHKDYDLLSNRTVAGVDSQGNKIRVTLREAVFAAYNTGVDQVDNGGKLHIGPIGYSYASSVQGLMRSSQPNQRLWGR